MLDLLLIVVLGFLGSFGHCVGMCGPLSVAFSLSNKQETLNWRQQLKFHTLLNLGRMLSYTLVGAGIGALGSVLLASGKFAGVGSDLRRWMAIITGLMLIWFGLRQIKPDLLPRIPMLHPLLQVICDSIDGNNFIQHKPPPNFSLEGILFLKCPRCDRLNQ